MLTNFSKKVSFLPRLLNMDVKEDENLLIVKTHYFSDTFNCVVSKSSLSSSQLEEAVNSFNKENLPMAWWLKDTEKNQSEIKKLKSLKLEVDEVSIGMTLNLNHLMMNSQNSFLFDAIRPATDPQTIKDIGSVIASVFDPPDESISPFYHQVSALQESENWPLKMFVGYKNNKPITTLSFFLEGKYGGIYDIATIKEERKKGYASCILSYCLEKMRSMGVEYAFLQASEDGFSLYQKIGFNKSDQFITLGNKQFIKDKIPDE